MGVTLTVAAAVLEALRVVVKDEDADWKENVTVCDPAIGRLLPDDV
jgi:hypothetical protein